MLEILRTYKPHDTPEDTFEVLVYEVGDIAKCIHHMRNFPKDRRLYRAELGKALSDGLVQLHLLCEWYGFDAEVLLRRGRENLTIRLKEVFLRRDST